MGALEILTGLSLLLIIGIALTAMARSLNISNILLLLIAGLILKSLKPLSAFFEFPQLFITVLGLIALIMIVFDSTSRFKLKVFGDLSFKALRLTIILIIFNFIILGIATKYIFNIQNLLLPLLFAAVMSGTDPGAVMVVLKDIKHKVKDLLNIESILNSPFTVILPFIVIDIARTLSISILSKFLQEIVPFLQKIIVGIGTGVLIGLIVFRAMKQKFSKILSPVSLIAAALLTYVISESLKGDGVLAVTTLGLIFGNVYLKEKMQLQTFGEVLSNTFEILVFILLGFFISIRTDYTFYIKVLALYAIYLIIRYASVAISLSRENLPTKERLFITLNASKGITTAVALFTLVTFSITGFDLILDVSLLFIVYSILFSTIISRFSKFFLGVQIKKSE